MSNTTIKQVYIDAFRDSVRQLAQQKTSKTRGWCDQFSQEAETGNWDRLGAGEAVAKPRVTATGDGTGRVWSRRIAIATPFKDDEVVEVEDPSLMLSDPNSNLVTSLGYSMGRKMDDIILTAAMGGALNSVRNSDGTNAPTTIAVPAAQIVGDFSEPISFDAITEIIEIFNTNDVDMEEPKVAIIGPRQVRELMNLTEQTSSDYVQVQALQQNGIVPNWMGFTWIMSTRLFFNSPTPAIAEQSCVFMSRKAMGFHIPQDIVAFVERDPSINYAWRPYTQFTAGAVRVEDKHLVVLRVLDSSIPAP